MFFTNFTISLLKFQGSLIPLDSSSNNLTFSLQIHSINVKGNTSILSGEISLISWTHIGHFAVTQTRKVYGVHWSNTPFFYLFGLSHHKMPDILASAITDLAQFSPSSDLIKQNRSTRFLYQTFINQYPHLSKFSAIFTISALDHNKKIMDLSPHFFHPDRPQFQLHGKFFTPKEYKIYANSLPIKIYTLHHGKSLGIILFGSLILSFIGFCFLVFDKSQPIILISPFSLNFHITFDLSFIILISQSCFTSSTYGQFYDYILFFSVISFLIFDFYLMYHQIFRIIKTFPDIDSERSFRNYNHSHFISKISLFHMLLSPAISAIIVKDGYKYPFLIFVLYSFYVPQIFTSYLTGIPMKHNSFLLINSISRLIQIAYIPGYYRFIYGFSNLNLILLVGLYFVLQVVIVLLQNNKRLFMKSSSYPLYQKHVVTSSFCVICYNSFENDNDIIITPCGHSFHANCLYSWFDHKHTCPLCRTPLPPIEIGLDHI